MLRLIAAELRRRRGRALALLAGIAVATASFTVLTGASESSRLEVRGDVAQPFRTAYDVLVRPRGAVEPLERDQGLVQQAFASGLFAGITMDQYREIRRMVRLQDGHVTDDVDLRGGDVDVAALLAGGGAA